MESRERLDDDPAEVVSEARHRLERAYDYEQENRRLAVEDVRFLDGDQWPSHIRQRREHERRPLLTINLLPQYVDRIVGEQRQNRPAIRVIPVEGKQASQQSNIQALYQARQDLGQTTSPGNPAVGVTSDRVRNLAGTKDYNLAEVMTGLIRGIEQRSDAEHAYDWAFQQAVEHGFGYWRVTTAYVDDDAFEQDIEIRRIRNAFTVYFDPASDEITREDAKWCIVSTEISRDEFKAHWPDASISDIEQTEGDWVSRWFHDDVVRIAEYWRKVPVKKRLVQLSDGRVVERDQDFEQVLDELAAQGITIQRERTVESYRIEWRLINGWEVLEGPRVWPGKYIPIVPCYGKELHREDLSIFRGAVRHAKEPQTNYNYWRTALTELVALAPKSPWLAAVEQIQGFEHIWKTANTENHAYLPYRADILDGRLGAPQRTEPAQIPSGPMNELMTSREDVRSTIGMYDENLGRAQQGRSGVAIDRLQRKGDLSNFQYMDNLVRAIRYTGRILIDLIPRIYDTERVIRILGTNEEEDFVPINLTVRDEQTGEDVVIADLSQDRYDVRVRAGPSLATQREEAQEGMLQFIQTVPDSAAAIADLFAESMDWPNSDKIAERLRRTVPPELLSETEREGIPEQQPSPEMQAEQAKLQAEQVRAEADIRKAEIELQKAQIDLQRAQLDVERGRMDVQRTGFDSQESIREQVAQAIADFLNEQQGGQEAAD